MKKTLCTALIFSLFFLNAFAKDRRKALAPKVKTKLMKVLEQNEKLHGAMFEYKKDLLVKEAKLYKKLVEKVKAAEFKKILKPTLSSIDELISSQAKNKDNESYHKVILALVRLVESYNFGSTYNVYYCPMVKKRWVQNSQKMRKVHNPYAPEMPHCGGQISEF